MSVKFIPPIIKRGFAKEKIAVPNPLAVRVSAVKSFCPLSEACFIELDKVCTLVVDPIINLFKSLPEAILSKFSFFKLFRLFKISCFLKASSYPVDKILFLAKSKALSVLL